MVLLLTFPIRFTDEVAVGVDLVAASDLAEELNR
jgi:hypothetical protein